MAAIFRDHRGQLLTKSNRNLPANSPLTVGALALQEALYMAESLGLKNITSEINSSNLFNACIRKSLPWQIALSVAEIKSRSLKI